MEKLTYEKITGNHYLVSSDGKYKITSQRFTPVFIIINDIGNGSITEFDSFNVTLSTARRAGFEIDDEEITKFLLKLSNSRQDFQKFNLGDYDMFKYTNNPIILKAIEKYGPDSKQVKAMIKLYKD